MINYTLLYISFQLYSTHKFLFCWKDSVRDLPPFFFYSPNIPPAPGWNKQLEIQSHICVEGTNIPESSPPTASLSHKLELKERLEPRHTNMAGGLPKWHLSPFTKCRFLSGYMSIPKKKCQIIAVVLSCIDSCAGGHVTPKCTQRTSQPASTNELRSLDATSKDRKK